MSFTIHTPKPVRTGTRAFRAIQLHRAKKQVEIADAITRHDEQLLDLIDEALDQVELDTLHVYASATYRITFDDWPSGDKPVVIPSLPVSAIDSLKYYDTNGTQQTMSSALYRLDTGRTVPVLWRADLDTAWPDLEVNRPQAVELNYTAGNATIDVVPSWMRQAGLARLAMLWADRGIGQIDVDKAERVYRSIITRRRSPLYMGANV